MSWSVPLMWEGGDVWIIGGGPSVSTQFKIPANLVGRVRNGESPMNALSPYMKGIHNKHVIGINAAYRLGDWIDIIFFGDNGFFLSNYNELAVHPAMKVTCWPNLSGLYPWVHCVARDPEKTKGITKAVGKLSWNGNSGGAAISVAAHAGAKRIFLLGFDMTLDPNTSHMHFHDAYKRGSIVEPERLMKLPFDRHSIGFQDIAVDAKEMGIEIYNVNPASGIESFPKISLSEALNL